jgi:hypothetical protein
LNTESFGVTIADVSLKFIDIVEKTMEVWIQKRYDAQPWLRSEASWGEDFYDEDVSWDENDDENENIGENDLNDSFSNDLGRVVGQLQVENGEEPLVFANHPASQRVVSICHSYS